MNQKESAWLFLKEQLSKFFFFRDFLISWTRVRVFPKGRNSNFFSKKMKKACFYRIKQAFCIPLVELEGLEPSS